MQPLVHAHFFTASPALLALLFNAAFACFLAFEYFFAIDRSRLGSAINVANKNLTIPYVLNKIQPLDRGSPQLQWLSHLTHSLVADLGLAEN